MSKYAKDTYWLVNSETGQKLCLQENQFSAFGIKLKDPESKWSVSEHSEENTKTKTENKIPKKTTFLIEKDGSYVRISESQIPAFKKAGWKLSDNQDDVITVEEKTKNEKEVPDDEITDDDIVNFLVRQDPENEELWNKDDSISQKTLNDHFGKDKVSKSKIQEIWPEFNRNILEGNKG